MAEHPSNPLAVSFFGCVMATNTIAFIAMHRYILRHAIQPEFAQTQPSHIILKSFVGVVSCLVGAACAWLSADVAFAHYLLTPRFFIVPPQDGKANT